MIFNHSHYVPALRWKAAEREALQWLGKAEKSRLMPLFEVIPNCFRNKDGEPLPLRNALRKIANEIDEFWGDSTAFIDLEHVAHRLPLDCHIFRLATLSFAEAGRS